MKIKSVLITFYDPLPQALVSVTNFFLMVMKMTRKQSPI